MMDRTPITWQDSLSYTYGTAVWGEAYSWKVGMFVLAGIFRIQICDRVCQ